MQRRNFLKTSIGAAGVGLAAGCLSSVTGGGGSYPSETVTWTIPYGQGGGQDQQQRALGPFLEDELGVSLALTNVTGGAGGNAWEEISQAEPTGYRIAGSILERQYLVKQTGDFSYDPFALTPIYQWARSPNAIVVRNDSPHQSVSDLVEASKQKPLKLGQVFIGGQDHLGWIKLKNQTGMKADHVPFDGGGSEMSALLGGRIDVGQLAAGTIAPQVESEKIRPLAILSPPDFEGLEKISYYDGNLPTITETDVVSDPINVFISRGTVAPPDLSEEKQEVLVDAFDAATNNDEWRSKSESQGVVVIHAGPEQYTENLQTVKEGYEPYIDELKKSMEELSN